MDKMIMEKFKHINDIMGKIGHVFDKCSDVGGKEIYPTINMLNLLSEAQTALEAVFFSLKREYQVMVDEKEQSSRKPLYTQNSPLVESDYIR